MTTFKRWLTPLGTCIAAAITVGVVCVFVIVAPIWRSLPDVSQPAILLAPQSVVITDRAGGELYRYTYNEDRTVVPLEEIPQQLAAAVIAIEDQRFLQRRICVDIRSIVRASFANVRDYKSQGASTITQQLARTAFLTTTKTWERKLREVLLACKLEHFYSKDEILTWYLNWISFGHNVAGIRQAAAQYFNKELHQLTLAESAVLAALPQRPTYFSPYGQNRYTHIKEESKQALRAGAINSVTDINAANVTFGLLPSIVGPKNSPVRLTSRTELVLKAMLQQGFITNLDFATAMNQLPLLKFTPLRKPIRAPHYSVTLRHELEKAAIAYPSLNLGQGLQVQTTLDPNLQQLAEAVLQKNMMKLEVDYGAFNAALLAVDRRTNQILAYAGNIDYFDPRDGQIDMVRVPRQPGSSFKPIVYAALLENGFTSDSRIDDKPLDPSIYRAHKSGYYGKMTVKTALARSRNVPAIRAFYGAGGEESVLKLTTKMGIYTPQHRKDVAWQKGQRIKYAWTLALGSAEASLYEMVEGYSTLANNGYHRPLQGFTTIKSNTGAILHTPNATGSQVISVATAEQLRDILSDEEARELKWRAAMHTTVPTALKTGTSTICLQRNFYGQCTDFVPNSTWTLGYNDDIVVGLWVGNSNNQPMLKDSAALDSALPVWKEFMEQALTIPTS